jgi:hypothetical protein
LDEASAMMLQFDLVELTKLTATRVDAVPAAGIYRMMLRED